MRLSKIRLAGFKSFVDPTTFQLPTNLVGIVGPNGCGKSNVIDAVRWVMGEMSARHLRGDAMADVIFNGSSSRKPVGTASIELFFDNADGSIGGQYSQYSEISLKRTLSRDGISSYFLNNARCRRKDITDLFLGTGLGSRSYAIIEQGMVSRLVDAKPDEMRTYIEEAAGISKYKERRRETELRIHHTRENLARLSDLREEISKQLEYLQRQAKTAERYKELKVRERRLEAELLVLRLTDLDCALGSARAELARHQTEMEAATARQRHIEAGIVAARDRHALSTDAFNSVQSRHYAVQSEISRLEQAIAHARELRERHQTDLAETRGQMTRLRSELDRDRASLDAVEATLAELDPDLVRVRASEAAAVTGLAAAEQALEQWKARWQDFSLGVSGLQQESQVERTRAEHLAAQVQQLGRQLDSILDEQASLSVEALDARLGVQVQTERDIEQRVEQLQARLSGMEREQESLRQAELAHGAELEQLASDMASCQGQLAALQAVQELALGGEDSTLGSWLEVHKLGDGPRLAQQLRADDRWVRAVETVLGDFLQAVCVDGVTGYLDQLPQTHVALVASAADETLQARGTLLECVSAPGQAGAILATVMTAPTLPAALDLLRNLQPWQSVITPDGIWLGPGWVRVSRGARKAAGLLARESEMRSLRESVARNQQNIANVDSARQVARERMQELGLARSELLQQFNAANRDHAEALAVLENMRVERSRAQERSEAMNANRLRLDAELATLRASLAEAGGRAAQADGALADLERRRPSLQAEQEQLLTAYNASRDVAQSERSRLTELSVALEGRRVSRESIQSSVSRLQSQVGQLETRAEQLSRSLTESEPAVASMQSELAMQLDHQIAVDRDLAAKRAELEGVEGELRASEGTRSSAEKAVAVAREATDALRMQSREIEIRRETVLEGLAANGADAVAVQSAMPADAEAGRWQEMLDEVRRKVERLGPINLTAIEQFHEQSERKRYLDAQNDDLTAALDTLEQAIRRIDRETRSRFQETFDNINQGLKRIFPRLFGGGHAYLSLEGDEILASGVTVMARPPGKRNSHIHLLSGGEKALTAVALIFSIFELNPAPFCLLDEVDAPLDEANVGRFCDIVAEMSQRVQFVVITHNKTTMEMVNQLTGVTMNEPGVSRLVSVDLDAAVQLAAS